VELCISAPRIEPEKGERLSVDLNLFSSLSDCRAGVRTKARFRIMNLLHCQVHSPLDLEA